MNDTATMATTAIGVSALLEALKDHVNLSPATLRWVAAVLGAVAGGAAGFIAGGHASGALVTNVGLASLLTTGTHSLLLQNSVLGRILKALGAALFEKPPASTPL